MKLEKWGVIAEIASAIAVIVTLMVLIAEVGGNTEAIRSQTAQETLGLSAQAFANPEGVIAFDKWVTGNEQLTDEELSLARARVASIFTALDNNYYQYLQDNLDPEIHDAFRARLEGLLVYPEVRAWWQFARPLMTQSFQKYVDEIIESQEQ
jgi:hypothetical protein